MKKFFVEIVKSFRSHDGFNLAANISFFAILSLLPLTMILFSVVGHVMGSGEIVKQIADSVTDVIPGAKDVLVSNIDNLIKSRTALGWWGLGFLLIVSTILFGSLERALDRVFECVKKRNFFHSRLLSILIIFMIAIFFFVPSTVGLIEATLAKYGFAVPIGAYLSGRVFFAVFAILSFVVVVNIVPNRKVYLRYAFVGGILYALGIGLARFLFRWYLYVSLDRYNLIYGSLAVLILTALWVYYLSNILIISAEVVAWLQRRYGVRGRR